MDRRSNHFMMSFSACSMYLHFYELQPPNSSSRRSIYSSQKEARVVQVTSTVLPDLPLDCFLQSSDLTLTGAAFITATTVMNTGE
jgi:hypothetical protein